jgi:hypothetical protein
VPVVGVPIARALRGGEEEAAVLGALALAATSGKEEAAPTSRPRHEGGGQGRAGDLGSNFLPKKQILLRA